MNLWESWYRNYEETEDADSDIAQLLADWSTQFATYFVLGGYSQNQAPLAIRDHEALALMGFLRRDEIDLDIVLKMAQEFTDDGSIQIPIQWLAEPEEIARIHTAWAHDLMHDEDPEPFWLTARPDLNRLPAAERVCWLLDAAEFILEMALMTNEAARVRIDTWAKLLYGERMLRASAPVLMLQANSAAAERRHHEIVASEVLGLPDALVAYCRADRLIKGHNLMQGPAIKEDQSIALSAALRLSQATQVELAQILEYLFLSLDEDPVSSTCLSDPLVWLEGTVHSAQSVFNHPRDGDALSGPELILLGRYLAQATALSRLNHLLTTRQQSKIRHWAAELFSS